MRLLNRESRRRRGADLSADVLQHLASTTSAVTAAVVRRRILKWRRDDVSNILDFRKVSGVPLESICPELIRYSLHNVATDSHLPEHHAIPHSLLVELPTQREIPVVVFQESDVYDIYRARCTGALHFTNKGSRND